MVQKGFDWDNVWQVGCGDYLRDYSDLFLRYGLMTTGSSDDKGPYDESLRPYDEREKWGTAVKDIWPIAVEVEMGDTIIAKKGYTIVGVGKVIGNYMYDGYPDWKNRFSKELCEASEKYPEVYIPFSKTRFDDVDGWDQRHTRPVEWHVGPELKCSSLSRATITKVHSEKTKAIARRFLEKADKREPESIPNPAKVFSNEDVIDFLMAQGMSSTRSEDLSQRLSTLQRLARWYDEISPEDVSEHEIRAYIVWPLLQVLGWSEQCVKFEWKSLDLALFESPYLSEKQVPIHIFETKKLDSGLMGAESQVEDYADRHNINKITVTDGIRYLLKNTANENDEKMYMNLLKLRNRHPYYEDIGGAEKLFKNLIK